MINETPHLACVTAESLHMRHFRTDRCLHCRFVHVPYTANQVAHLLALVGLRDGDSFYRTGVEPSFILAVVAMIGVLLCSLSAISKFPFSHSTLGVLDDGVGLLFSYFSRDRDGSCIYLY